MFLTLTLSVISLALVVSWMRAVLRNQREQTALLKQSLAAASGDEQTMPREPNFLARR